MIWDFHKHWSTCWKYFWELLKALLLIIENWESGEKKLLIFTKWFSWKSFCQRNLIIISITILARFLSSTFWGEIKMIVIMRQENEKFIQHWKKLLLKRDSKERKKIRKREKSSQNFVFSFDLRTSFPLIEMMWQKENFYLKTKFPSSVHRIQLPTLEAGGSYFDSPRKVLNGNLQRKKVKLKEKCEKLLGEKASTRIKWNTKKIERSFCDYVIKGKSFDQELEKK
jgi:hypothetical protein